MHVQPAGASIEKIDSTIFLKGDFFIAQTAFFSKPKQILADLKDILTIDLKGVSQLDSSLLALLVEYRKIMPDIKIIHAPANLVQLMQVYELRDFI
jgi:ABC-type transporter Mla MlaB component